MTELERNYKLKQDIWKTKIKSCPNKHKRFWKWVIYLVAFPFVWLFYNIRDWRTFVIFIIVFVVMSSEIWIPYLLGVIFWKNEPLRISMFSFGSACWLFWLGPFTPFFPICISITILVKTLFNKIKNRKVNKQKELEMAKKCPYYIDKEITK